MLVNDGAERLETLAANCVEFLFHYRVLARQSWRAPVAYNRLAFESAIHGFDSNKATVRNLEIILAPLIEAIEGILDPLMPHRSMNVYTIERCYGEVVLTNFGDYRILKFQAEHPEWKPTKEEPEELIMRARANMNFLL